MKPKNIKILLAEKDISKRIEELGKEITEHYAGEELVLVGIIKGALPFFLKLSSKIKLSQKWDFMALSSYGNKTETSGIMKINMDLGSPILGAHVLIVEDIIDTGLTIDYLVNNLKTRKPASLKICTLLFKEENFQKKVNIDFIGFKIPNRFVFGFGLDVAEKYRELPHIGYIEE